VTAPSANEESYKQGIIDFVSTVSVLYSRHSGAAVNEDMLIACVEFDIDPSAFFDSEDEARNLRAEVAAAKVRKGA
jgi:hypothetical protein